MVSWYPGIYRNIAYPQARLGMIAHGRKNIFACGWGSLCSGITVPPGPDFCGVDVHHRRLVSADMGKLGGFHRRWWARPSRLGTEMGAREGQGGVF